MVIEKIDLRARVVHDNQIVQPISVEIGHVKLADLGIDGENLRASETERVGITVFSVGTERKGSGN